MEKGHNLIYDDAVVKTTVNIEKSLMKMVKIRMKKLGIRFFSTYLRALLMQDVKYKKTVSLGEFLGMDESEHPDATMPTEDPPRKYSGAYNGLKKSSFTWNWFKEKQKQEMDNR